MIDQDQEDLATLDARIGQEIRDVLERHPIPITIPDVPSLLPADQENEEAPLDRESWFKKKGIVATFEGVFGHVSRVLYDSSTLGCTSSKDAKFYDVPFNEGEGYKILDQMVDEIVSQFGEGPVYVKAQCHPTTNGGDFYQDFAQLEPFAPRHRRYIKVVDRETPFGGGDNGTGWYVVSEYRFDNARQLIEAWAELGDNDVFDLDRALQTKKFGYKESAIAEGSTDEQYRMY